MGELLDFPVCEDPEAVETEAFPIREREWGIQEVHPLAWRYRAIVDCDFLLRISSLLLRLGRI